MGVQAVKKIFRKLSYKATWAANVLTITTVLDGTSTPTPHYLKNGDIISLILTEVTNEVNNKVVTYVDANTFTIPVNNYLFPTSAGFVRIPFYSTGQTGNQDIFTLCPSSQNQSIIIQFTAHGTAGAVLVLSVSNDQDGWVPVATVTLASSDKATDFIAISNCWNYGRISITSIGAATSVVVTVAS